MTIEELATELGIDLAAAKPESVAKVRGYFADADTQYKTAKELKEASEENLRKVQKEQDEINTYIAQYGASEQTNAALRANYAAMEAQLKNLKEQGLNVNLPDPLKPAEVKPAANAFDPAKFSGQVSNVIAQSINLNNKYQLLFGKPLPDDIDALATQAQSAGKGLYEYAAQKYDFGGEEKRKSDAASAAHDAEVAAKAVAEFREKNPNTSGNPFVSGGGESNHPQIFKPRDAKDQRAFANMSPREKIAQSVSRSRELITANQS